MKNNNEHIPNCLTAHRKVTQYKQNEVAALLGMDKATCISLWENGVTLPSTLNLLKLYILYGVPLEELYPELIKQLRIDLLQKQQFLKDKRTRDDGT